MRIVMKLLAVITIPTLLAFPAVQAAQGKYPAKPVRLIIGSAPGSGPDIISRMTSDRLYSVWKQRIVVDSRPGASGKISADLALQAIPDGYTWMMLTSQLFVASQVLPGIKFDLARDFQSIALIGTVPFVLLANPTLPAKSVKELVALAKKSPGKLSYGSAGIGSSEHLSGVLLTQMTGTKMLHVPYKGVAQSIMDVIANEVQITYAVAPAARAHVETGRLRALGVTPPTRSPLFPDVPSISETIPGFAMYGWYSIVAPTGTPDAILNMVSKEVVKAAKDPAFGARLKNNGIEIVAGDRKALDAWRRSEDKRIRDLVRTSGAKVK